MELIKIMVAGVFLYGLTVATCKWMTPEVVQQQQQLVAIKRESICQDGDPRGVGYLPLGVRDTLWDRKTSANSPVVMWSTIEIPERAFGISMDKEAKYLTIMGKIDDYRHLLKNDVRIGLKGHYTDPTLNEMLQYAAQCSGIGFIPQVIGTPTVIAIQESICVGGHEEFWRYDGDVKVACAKAVAMYQPVRQVVQLVPTNPVPPPPPVVQDASEPRGVKNACQTAEQVFPGKLVDTHWVPDNCDIKQYNDTSGALCVKSVPFLSIGDTLSRSYHDSFIVKFWRSKIREDKIAGPDHTAHIWTPSTMTEFGTMTRGNKATTPVDVSSFLKTKAKFILYSVGSWDVGAHFCGTDQYYTGLKDHVSRYRNLAGPNTTMALYMLPYIHHDKASWIRTCNPVGKLTVYREIMLQVASCLNLPVFNVYPIQKQYPSDSPDGLHMYGEGLLGAGEVLLNVMCDGLGLWYPKLPCSAEDEERVMARWREDPVANRRSPDCRGAVTCSENATMLPPLDESE
eukprot:TRINITY_DN2315_c0_g1_i1.p1 TRINITY_DN2315_c0_g1~~TRINITY_DN2315_c0_g1_i1.p1  ORF type:complete len:532 (+),score=148.37 TRINITY_DN2315_c0_g1_i1:61-1596(+)